MDMGDLLAELTARLLEMKADDDRQQLAGNDPDFAFELGYGAAIRDMVTISGYNEEEK